MAFAMTSADPTDETLAVPGPTRKPGNLWTAEAREDMYKRREAGEGWETICQDYPTRTRHAMQQQYSMMKKQRALESGTWAMNRRGRKRRMTSPERTGEGEFVEDDFSDEIPERNRGTRLPPFSTIVSRNPVPQLRISTDPIYSRPFPAMSIPPLSMTREGSSSTSPITSSNSPDHKRQKLRDHPLELNPHRAYDQWHPKLPDLAFTEADVAALIQKGRDQAARIIEDVNHRNELIRKGKDDQISRYVTQLRETQDQLALEKGSGPYAQELNHRDREIDTLRGSIAALQESLDARNGRCSYLENENTEMKARLVDIGKRETTSKAAGTDSPPSTPRAYRTSSRDIAAWQQAMDGLSKDIDGVQRHIKTIRTHLDDASDGQIISSADEVELTMSSMLRNRDKALLAFDKLQTREEGSNN